MLYARDVIRFEGDDPKTHRVVWADQRDVWLFDLDAKRTSFRRMKRAELEARLDAREAVLLTAHGYDAFFVGGTLSEKRKERRDKLAEIISPIVARAPEIFDDRLRGTIVADLDRAKVSSSKTVHAALDRWWRGGMTLDTLLPAFDAIGKAPRKEGAKKVGPWQPEGTPPGIPVTPEIEKIFEKAVRRFYSNDLKNSLSATYQMMRGTWFVDKIRDPVTGVIQDRIKPEYAKNGYPTLRQFRYWYGKRDDRLQIRRRRLGAENYEKDNRAITGSASKGLIGVGSRFEIDATKLEHGLVSEIHPGTYLDPPTFYQVTDVYTSLVCGIYVGFEKSDWTGAGLAIRNVVEDKVEFARRYGVTITADQWPCQGVLPARLLADNAEFKGDLATEFTAKSHVTVENAAALRGDMKGTVEGKFSLFKRELRKQLPGLVKKNQATPGEVDHRADAAMTIRHLTAAVIETVVHLNSRKLVNFARKREMIEAGVFAVPKDMWAWAARTGASELRRFDMASAEFAMLPTETVSVTKNGVKFKKLFYSGVDAHADEYAFARQNGVTKIKISYDPLWTTNIFAHDPKAKGGYRTLKLTGASWEYRDICFEDAEKLKAADDKHTKNMQFEAAEADSRLTRRHAEIGQTARKENPGKRSKSDIAKGRKNSEIARKEERQARTSALRATDDVKPSIVIDGTALFAAQKERTEAKQDIFGESGMSAWLAGKDNNETP